MLGILAYVIVSVADCDIGKYAKDCTCIIRFFDDLDVSFDETVDNTKTTLINSIDEQIIFSLLLSYCVFTIVGDQRS